MSDKAFIGPEFKAGTSAATPSEAPPAEARQSTFDELRPYPMPDAAPQSAGTPPARILVIENNPDMNEFLVAVLGRDYRVNPAYDGREGLEKALADPPDLILSDIMMPGMSAERMVQEMRSHGSLDDVPIVILTAKVDDELRMRLLRHGVQDYLQAPLVVEELLARIDGLLAERRRIRQRLRQSQAQFRAAFEQAAVGIALVAPDGRWLRVNQKLCDIAGYAREELMGGRFQDITHPEDLEADMDQVRRLLAGEINRYSIEKRYLRKDGTPLWVNVTGTLVRDEAGASDYFIKVIEDIRLRKESEAEVRRLTVDLERRVEERTAELRAANQELDSFAYAVSHDLCSPLRAMSGFRRALLEDYGDQLVGEARVYLEQIDIASQRMGELIDGLLVLSRSTRAELRRDVIDLTQTSVRILAELAGIEPEHQVETEVQPGLIGHGDTRMIEAIMQNLISNAWKYTGRTAHPKIAVFSERKDGSDMVCVQDNGAGFDMSHAAKLFQPFQRLHRQEEFPGIGIGLATVQRIINRHGGLIKAEGAPGRGATFCFSLAAASAGTEP